MIAVEMEFDGESKRLMKRLERETPITFKTAHAAAATRVQNRLRKVMRSAGGMYGVPSFAPLSEMSKRMRPNQKPGGILADKGMIHKWRQGDGQVVGWVDRVTEWASNYQGAARYAFQQYQKASLHRTYRQLDGYHIPDFYDRPARMVIDPFSAHLAVEFPKLVLDAFDKAAGRAMRKWGVVR